MHLCSIMTGGGHKVMWAYIKIMKEGDVDGDFRRGPLPRATTAVLAIAPLPVRSSAVVLPGLQTDRVHRAPLGIATDLPHPITLRPLKPGGAYA